MDNHPILTWIGNALGGGAIVGALVQWVPIPAAIIAMVWYAIQIKESQTYREWRAKRHQRQLAKLRASIAALEKKLPPSQP